MNDWEQRLARAEAAIERLTAELAASRERPTTVMAPFRVVNAEGRVLLEVDTSNTNTASEANRINIYNRHGQVTTQLGVQAEGGFIAIRDDAGKLVANLTTEAAGARLELLSSCNAGGVAIGTDDDGGWMNVLHASENSISVALGSDAQGGQLQVSSDSEVYIFPTRVSEKER